MNRVLALLVALLAASATSALGQAPPEAARGGIQGIPIGFAEVSPLGTAPTSRPVVSFRPLAPVFVLATFRLDGVDVTPLVAVSADGAYSYQPLLDLAAGEHVASIEHAGEEASWTFETPLPAQQPEASMGFSIQGESGRFHSEQSEPLEGDPSRRTVSAATAHAEGVVTDLKGNADASFNATMSQPYDSSSPPVHAATPAAILMARKGAVRIALGSFMPETFSPSLLVQTVSTRRGLELGLDAGPVVVRLYGNIDDGLPSSAGVNEYRQNLYGISLSPNLGNRFKLRTAYQYVSDARDPLYEGAPLLPPEPGAGAAVGGVATLGASGSLAAQQPLPFGSAPRKGHLVSFQTEWLAVPSIAWSVKAEVVRSASTLDRRVQGLESDWAYAVSTTASPFGFSLLASAQVVGDAFGSPANPALVAGRKLYTLGLGRGFGPLNLSVQLNRTDDSGGAATEGTSFRAPEGSADSAALTASYMVPATGSMLSLSVQGSDTTSGEISTRGRNVALNVAHPFGPLQASVGLMVGRQESAGLVTSDSETGGATVSLSLRGEVFSIQPLSFSVNRTHDPLSGQTMTVWSAFAMPDFTLLKGKLSLTPTGAWSRATATSGAIPSGSESYSWGGRVTLRTWGSLRGFAVFGQYIESTLVPTAIVPAVEGSPRTRDRRLAAAIVVLLGGGSLGPTFLTQTATPQTPLQ